MGRPTLATLKRVGIALAAPVPLRPRLPASGPASVPEEEGVELVVAAINLQQDDRDRRAQAAAVVEVDADVLLLVEHTELSQRALREAAVADRWPHLADDPDDEYFGSLVASRHPIVRAERCDLGGRRGQVVDLDVAGVTTRVVPVHTQAPIHDHDLRTWLDTIAATVATAVDAPGPVVLAGDWNATGGNRRFRRAVEEHDLVDAATALGLRWAPTWPAEVPERRVRLRPLLTLDHVVVSADVEVVALDRISVPGSDHLGLRATLRLPRAGPPPIVG